MKICPKCLANYQSGYTVCPQDGSVLRDAAIWSEGSVIRGKYRILGTLGRGGMGTVYKALHLAFDELRAIKVIAPEILHDEVIVRRFRQEAVITRKLQHPNAVRVEDIDEAEDGRPFIVMEFIQGKSLKKVIQEEGPLPVSRVCSIVKQVAAALDAAHSLGMVHRDIKPENIALIESPDGERVKVLDFGIAKMKESSVEATSGKTLTAVGMVVGTVQYMSPEQAMGKRGDELDGRSDLYSLGIVMYEMLTASLPFKAQTTMAMLLAHLQEPPNHILTVRPDLQIPEPIADLAMRLLEKDPERRPANGRALIEEVEAAEKGIAPMSPARVDRDEESGILNPTTHAAAPAPLPPPVWKPESGILNPASRVPAPASMPTPTLQIPSRWGIWVGIAILIVGLGGGGWYIWSRHSSSLRTRPPAGFGVPSSGANTQGPAAPPVDPKKIKGAITLGDFYLKNGNYADAIKAYQDGLILDPSNPDLLDKLQRARKAGAVEQKVLQ